MATSFAEELVVDVLVRYSKPWAQRYPGGLTVDELVGLVGRHYAKGRVEPKAIVNILHNLLQREIIFGLPPADLTVVEEFAFLPVTADAYTWIDRIPDSADSRMKRFYVGANKDGLAKA